jgi:asparagine synthase (glutamine-hydrolysing)
MRLICGFYHLNGKPAEVCRLVAMTKAMISPELKPKIATLVSHSVAMAVLDFSNSPQETLIIRKNGLILAADARLDDTAQLARKLDASEQDNQDSLLLWRALKQWGVEGLNQVWGDFALAAWDEETQSLLCARDIMGIRPLFTTRQPGHHFAFASLPGALHAGAFVSRQLDESYIADDLLKAFSSSERSLFQGIARVPPAHSILVSAQTVRTQAYWKLNLSDTGKAVYSVDTAAEMLRHALTQAVTSRLPPSGPVAAHLSGGLDSSSITALAARSLRKEHRPLYAYSFLSATDDALHDDETLFVQSFLEQETDLRWQPIAITDFNRFLMPQMDSDQFFVCDTAIPDMQVCQHAASHGAHMLLTGWGGDEGASFGGRCALTAALKQGHFNYLIHELRALSRVRNARYLNLINGEILRYLLPEGLHSLLKRLFSNTEPTTRTAVADTTKKLITDTLALQKQGKIIKITANADLNRFNLLTSIHLTRRAEQWALSGARYGLAVSFPMLDRRVIELVQSFPNQLFLQDGYKRSVFRNAMAGILPERIRLRHSKFMPCPEAPELPARQRAIVLSWLNSLKSNAKVTRLFNLHTTEQLLIADHTPLEARALIHVFRAICYIEQHG